MALAPWRFSGGAHSAHAHFVARAFRRTDPIDDSEYTRKRTLYSRAEMGVPSTMADHGRALGVEEDPVEEQIELMSRPGGDDRWSSASPHTTSDLGQPSSEGDESVVSQGSHHTGVQRRVRFDPMATCLEFERRFFGGCGIPDSDQVSIGLGPFVGRSQHPLGEKDTKDEFDALDVQRRTELLSEWAALPAMTTVLLEELERTQRERAETASFSEDQRFMAHNLDEAQAVASRDALIAQRLANVYRPGRGDVAATKPGKIVKRRVVRAYLASTNVHSP